MLNTCEPTFCDFGTDAETFRPMKCTLNTGIVTPCVLKANRKLGLDTARASTIYEIEIKTLPNYTTYKNYFHINPVSRKELPK